MIMALVTTAATAPILKYLSGRDPRMSPPASADEPALDAAGKATG